MRYHLNLTTKLSLRVQPDLEKQLKTLAKAARLPFTFYVRSALWSHVEDIKPGAVGGGKRSAAHAGGK